MQDIELATHSSLVMGSLGKRVPFGGDGDPYGVTNLFSGVYHKGSNLTIGIIIYYNPQTHTAAVDLPDQQRSAFCYFADESLSCCFGFSATHPARSGEPVLVHIVDGGPGVIVGRVPYELRFRNKVDPWNDPDEYHRRLYTQRPGTEDLKISSFWTPLENPEDPTTHVMSHLRPTDVYPGEFAHVNQHNCGMKGGLFSVTLLGGGANLRLSALTNAARMSCDSYIRHSMLGNTREFHNGRYLSFERDLALYQEERLGGVSQNDTVWTEDSEAPKEGENQTIRPRMKDLAGFFGHMSSRFCFRPDPNESGVRVLGKSKPNEEGVYRETVDPSGQFRLSAAGMLTFERTGRIPVPVRIADPSAKDHDIPGDPSKLALKPFEHEEKDPGYRQLELFDRQAYDLMTQYARVDGYGAGNPDYHVPQEKDLKPLTDSYDKKFTDSTTVKLNKYDKRRAGVYIGEDGSIIMRDAWGSEIVMLGGNISMSCAGNVMILPGKTALTIAGDDIVHKAQNSIDIHASEHDIRLSAARNMEIVGGGDDSNYSGGVIIESKGKGVSPGSGHEDGEGARLSGIVLKTKDQGVVLDGKSVNIRSKKDTSIISGDKKIDGAVTVSAKNIRTSAEQTLILAKDSMISVQNNSVDIAATSVGMYAKSSLNAIKGGKYPVPMQWVDVGTDPASEILPDINSMAKNMLDEEKVSGAFPRYRLNKIKFSFRTSEQCGTNRPWVLGATGKFTMYEPSWVQVAKIYETLKSINTKTYEEKAKWDSGRPFPGKEAEDSAVYAKLSGGEPQNLSRDGGFNKPRTEVKPKSNIETPPLKSEYVIRS